MSEDASAVSAGRLYLDVVADTTGLSADLKAKLDAVSRELKMQVTATVVADTAKAKADIDEAARDRTAKIKADADAAQARADLDAAAKDRLAKIQAKADAAQAKADLDAAAKDRAAAIKAVATDVSTAKAAIDEAAKDRKAKITSVADNVAAAKAQIDAVAADRTAKIKAGTSGLAEASAEIDAVAHDRTVKIKALADTAALQSTIADIGGTISGISKGAGIGAGLLDAAGAAGNLAGGLIAVVGAASQAAGVIGALPGLLLGAAQGAGVLKLGFSGISAAVGAMTASQTAAGTSAQAMASAQQSAQNSVRTSAQALAAAQISAVQSVAAAQHTVQTSIVATAQAQYDAIQSVQQAEHSLTDAQFAETQGQLALTAARVAAQQNLVQMAYDLRGAVLGEAQASLTLQEAQIKLTQINQSVAATPQEKAQAALDVQNAQLALDESKTKIQTTAAAKALADKQGVDGSTAVVAAVHSQADAVYSLQNAQQTASRAQMLANQSVAAAEYSQSQAVQSLTNARTSASVQLLNAQIAYSQALTAARNPLLGVSSQTTALATALKALSPAGQEFAAFVYNQLLPRIKTLKFAIQEALLPPVQAGVEAALPLLDTLKTGLVGTATVMGSFAQQLGTFLGSAATQVDLSSIMSTNNAAFGSFGDAILHILDALKNVAVAAEPLVLEISKGVDHVAQAIDMMSKAGRADGGMAQFFHDAWVSAVLLGKIIWNILDGIGHLFKAGNPAGTSLLGSLEKATKTFSDWTGSASGQARLKAFFDGTVPVVKQFADLIVHAGQVLGPFLASMGGGQYNVMFAAFKDILDVLNALVRIPGLGPVINWIIALSLVGLGLGKVAANIKGISDGLKTLGKITGLSNLFGGAETDTAATGMQTAGDTMLAASENMLRAAGIMPAAGAETAAASAEGSAEGSALGAGIGSKLLAGGIVAAIALAITELAVKPLLQGKSSGTQNDSTKPGNWWDNPAHANPTDPRTAGQGFSTWAGAGTMIKDWLGFGQSTPARMPGGGPGGPGGAQEQPFGPNVGEMDWTKWWQDFDRDVAHKITDWFTKSLPDAFTQSVPHWFSGVWGSFDRDVVHKITDFVTVTIPHTFTASIPGWFDSVWGRFQSAVIAPVRGWVLVTLPAFFTSTIPHWFDSTWASFTAHVLNPVKTWVTSTLPGYFTSTIPRWFTSAVASFTAHVLNPVKTWVTSTLPGYFTSTIPNWFKSVAGQFSTHVITPVSTFFKTTLPGVIEGAFKGGFNWIIGKINSLTSHIPGIGKALQIPALATGGIVPGGYSREDNQLAWLRSGEGVLQPGAVSALGGERFINWANAKFGDVPAGSGGPGHYAGGGIHFPNPITAITGAAKAVAGVVGNAIADAARLVPGALRFGFDHLWSAAVQPSVNSMVGWGLVGGMGVDGADSLKGAIDSFLGAQDASGTGNVGSGSGADVARYAASYATGQGHPYVTGGQGPKGWDCSGFSAWVYEHFGYFPGAQKSRYGTSESQFADPLLQSSGPQTGALVFFDDGVYANPGHVGVLINPSSYVGADSPAVGTVISGIGGNVGFRVPKGGFQTSTAAKGLIPANAGPIAAYLSAHGFDRNATAGILGNIWQECVTLDTMILTRRGWLKHDAVQPGDETIGYNPETGRSEWTPVTAVQHYADRPVVRYGNQYWHAEFTTNHRFLMEEVRSSRTGFLDDLAVKPGLTCPECGVAAGTRKPFTNIRSVQIHRAKMHGAAGVVRDGAVRPETAGQRALVEFGNMTGRHRIVLAVPADTGVGLPITVREASLLGWIAGDGSVRRETETRLSVSIWQSKTENFEHIDRACGADPERARYAPRPGRKPHHKPSTEWRLSSAYARDLLSRAGDPKADAVSMVLAMSTAQRDAWLEAIWLAEGSSTTRQRMCWQDAGEIADAIEIAVYLAGNRPGRYERLRAGKTRVMITRAIPHIGGPGRNSFTKDAGVQDVWCVTTGLGSWTARSPGGGVFLTGNSKGNPAIGLIQITGDLGGSLASELVKTMQYIMANGSVADINAHSSTPTAAAVYFSEKYERPGIPMIQNRIASANASYAAGYDQGGPVHPGANWLLNSTGRDEWVLTPPAVDMLGGPAAVQQLNMTAKLYQGSAAAPPVGAAAAHARAGGGAATVNVFPQRGQSEEEIGSIAARKLGIMLSG